MPRGGLRTGAGRKKNSPNKATQERQAKVAATGAAPLDVMIESMRFFRAQAAQAQNMPNPDKAVVRENLRIASSIAKDAAPYVHPRLESITHSGDPDNPLEVLTRIERVIVGAQENATDRDAERIPTTH
jgi:hypothetical protein